MSEINKKEFREKASRTFVEGCTFGELNGIMYAKSAPAAGGQTVMLHINNFAFLDTEQGADVKNLIKEVNWESED